MATYYFDHDELLRLFGDLVVPPSKWPNEKMWAHDHVQRWFVRLDDKGER